MRDSKTVENRKELVEVLAKLGYECAEAHTFGLELTDRISDYVHDRISGDISDFIVVPNEEVDPSGLIHRSIYRIYVKK